MSYGGKGVPAPHRTLCGCGRDYPTVPLGEECCSPIYLGRVDGRSLRGRIAKKNLKRVRPMEDIVREVAEKEEISFEDMFRWTTFSDVPSRARAMAACVFAGHTTINVANYFGWSRSSVNRAVKMQPGWKEKLAKPQLPPTVNNNGQTNQRVSGSRR